MIKWKKSDVIKAFNEAMSPSQNGQGTNQLLQQLLAKAKRPILPTTTKLTKRK